MKNGNSVYLPGYFIKYIARKYYGTSTAKLSREMNKILPKILNDKLLEIRGYIKRKDDEHKASVSRFIQKLRDAKACAFIYQIIYHLDEIINEIQKELKVYGYCYMTLSELNELDKLIHEINNTVKSTGFSETTVKRLLTNPEAEEIHIKDLYQVLFDAFFVAKKGSVEVTHDDSFLREIEYFLIHDENFSNVNSNKIRWPHEESFSKVSPGAYKSLLIRIFSALHEGSGYIEAEASKHDFDIDCKLINIISKKYPNIETQLSETGLWDKLTHIAASQLAKDFQLYKKAYKLFTNEQIISLPTFQALLSYRFYHVIHEAYKQDTSDDESLRFLSFSLFRDYIQNNRDNIVLHPACNIEAPFLLGGKNIYVGRQTSIDSNCVFGDHVVIIPFFFFYEDSSEERVYPLAEHTTRQLTVYNEIPDEDISKEKQDETSRPEFYICIGENTILLEGTRVFGQINIGNHTIIGRHATVTSDIPQSCEFMGDDNITYFSSDEDYSHRASIFMSSLVKEEYSE